MKIPMSSRLLTCCSFVKRGARVADIGCDHGYLGIYLLTEGIAQSTIEADIAPQPLDCAKKNGEKYGVSSKMQFCLSNGAEEIPRDFDTFVCAGMGADTMISIFTQSPWLKCSNYRFILQCQSRRAELRQWLSDNDFCILRETLAQDGKFIYPVMEVCYGRTEKLTPAQCYISPALLDSASPLLPAFYHRVLQGIQTTVDGLSQSGSDKLPCFQGILTDLKNLEGQIHA